MTQIKKTLSIAGIIALVGAPAMAEIASTQYVQSIVNNVIPKTGTVGDVLKKTADGFEWAAAPTTTLETTTGTSTTSGMTQKAISDELDAKLGNNATGGKSIAIGDGAQARGDYAYDYDSSKVIGNELKGAIAIGEGAIAMGEDSENEPVHSIAIGPNATSDARAISIGDNAQAYLSSIAIGDNTDTVFDGDIAIGVGAKAYGDDEGAVVIGNNAKGSGIAIGSGTRADGYYSTSIGGVVSADYAIQLGPGSNNEPNTFNVSLGESDDAGNSLNYPLLVAGGMIPAARLAGGFTSIWDDTDEEFHVSLSNGVRGQLLQTNGDGTMSWVDAPASSLDSMLPTAPNDCKASVGQKCALVTTWNGSKYTYTWEVVKVNQ